MPPTFAKMMLRISLKSMRKCVGKRVVANLQRSRECGLIIFIYVPHFYSPGHAPACLDNLEREEVVNMALSFKLLCYFQHD